MTDDPFSRIARVQTEAFTRLRLQVAVHKGIPGSNQALLEWRDVISQDPSFEVEVDKAFDTITDRTMSLFRKALVGLSNQELDELTFIIGAVHTPEGSRVTQKEVK